MVTLKSFKVIRISRGPRFCLQFLVGVKFCTSFRSVSIKSNSLKINVISRKFELEVSQRHFSE